MTTIGTSPSQPFKDLVNQAKAANGNEKAGVINQQEADAIKQKFFEEAGKIKTESAGVEFVNATKSFLESKDGFAGTNVLSEISLDDKVEDFNPTSFSFKIKGEFKPEAKPEKDNINVKVTDYENTDKDKQFSTLKSNKNNFIEYSKEGNVTGLYVSGKGSQKPDEFGVGKTMKDVVKNDFKMHADLTKVFPNNEEGAQKFLGTLQKLPGNSAGKPTITDAKDLLNFINTGSDGKGEGPTVGNNPGKIQRLQVLLEKCCGTMGEEIRGKNTPKGGDDHYGYATTLQIRALSGAINNEAKIDTPTQIESKGEGQILDKDFTKLIPENKQVMIAMDVSGSMNGNDRSTLTKYADVINDNPSSDLGFMVFNSNSGANDSGGSVLFKPGKGNESISQEQKKVNTNKSKLDEANANVNNAQKKFDDLNTRYISMKSGPEKTKVLNEKNEARLELNDAKFKLSSSKNELNQANNELKTKQRNLVSQSIGSANGTHAESGSKAALKSLEQMDPKGKEPYVIVQTDEPDKNIDSMKDLVKQGLSKKVDPKSVVFFNPDTKETVSLEEIISKVSTNGSFDESKFNKQLVNQEGKSFAIYESDFSKYPPAK